MSLLRKFRLAAPLGLGMALFSPVTAQQSAVPVVQPVPAAADSADGFQSYLQLVGAKARGQGVSQRAVDSIIGGLTYNPRVVSLDRSQPGSTPGSPPAFWPYYARHIGAERINRGRTALAANADLVGRMEGQYGVPAKMIIAIWGKETFYGRIMGDFDLARSLATLAYEDNITAAST